MRRLVADAREGRSGVLVLHGEAGVGKSALLEDLVADAPGVRVLRATGLEREAHLAHAALAELLDPLLHLRDGLPPAQARALGCALALEDGQATPFAVAAGALSLLAAGAEDAPTLVVVDDLQWLDDASRGALLFVARRLDREGLAVVLAARDDEGLDVLDLGLPTLPVTGLAAGPALRLLDDAGIAPAVAERLVAATDGSPLALLEIPTLLTPEQRSGAEPLDDPLPIGRDLEHAFRRRIGSLPVDARRALVVAACAGDLRPDVVLDAVVGSGLDRDALLPAEEAGVLRLELQRIVFRHPLLRAATLATASPVARRAAHRALAAVLPEDGTARAWHLGAAAEGADPEAAGALAAAAADARDRGAPDEAARAFARAADLEQDGDARARLLLEASVLAALASRAPEAVTHAQRGAELARDELLRADLRAAGARADIRTGAALSGREVLVQEGERLVATDPARAGIFLLEAAVVDMASGRLRRMVDVGARAATLARHAVPPVAFLADTIVAEARLALGESAAGDAALAASEDVLRAFEVGTGPPPVVAMAAHSSLWVERFERAETILERLIGRLRDASAVAELVYPLAVRSHLAFRLGRLPSARADASEAVRLGDATGQELVVAHALGALAEVEAALGHDEDARAHAGRCLALAQAQGADATAIYGHGALAFLASGRRDPEEAVRRALAAARSEARTDNDEPGIVRWAPELVEALWRLGRHDEAREQVERLQRQADRPGHTWARAVVLRSRGLLAPDDDVDDLFAAALALHDQTPQPLEAGRTRLLHGERLRRARRPADARGPLHGALATFERLGTPAWIERARTELQACGGQETPAVATVGAVEASAAVAELTPQELQIALHAARGMTNREVGAALFLAPKTVEHHLSRTFRKLGIRRRVELADALRAEPAVA